MRFGLPLDFEVDVPPPPARPENLDQLLIQMSQAIEPSPVLTPLEMLSDALNNLELLKFLKLEATSRSQRESLRETFESFRIRADRQISLVASELAQKQALQDLEVKRILENQERLRKQEEERKRRIMEAERLRIQEEERKRLEQEKLQKEEEERKKKEDELRKKEEDLKKQKLAEEEQRKAQEQKVKEENARKALKEKLRLAKEQAAKKSKGFTNKTEVEQMVLKYRQDIVDIKKNVTEKLSEDKELKKNVNNLKRKVNVKFGQLSNSMSQLNTICKEVVELVNLTQNNPLAFKWLLNFISKAIVAQAEAEVTVKPTAALPLARLANHLLENLPGLDYFLCARFVKKCSFIVGYTCSIDTEEGRVRMGWKRSNEKWEDEVKYDERMGGICTVWAVMARLGTTKIQFFSMESEWKFLARMLNTEESLLTNTHYGTVGNWWEAAAQQLSRSYGKQADKMFALATQQWSGIGKKKHFPAATRLEVLGDEWRSKRTFSELKEMER